MKIAICHTDFRLYWLSRLKALADFLNNNDAELHVIEIAGKGSPYSFADKADQKNYPSHWTCLFPDKRMENIASRVASSFLYKKLEELCPDIVIAGAIAYPSGATAVHWSRQKKSPVIIMDDARLSDVPRSAFVNWVKRRIYDNVDAVFIPAPSHVPDYKFCGFYEDQMFYGINVVDNQFFTERSSVAKKNADAVRKKYGLPAHYFLGIGRQITKKNWGALIQAFISIKEKDKWGLVLVGDGPEASQLKQNAANANCNIVFLPFQNQENLCEIYSVADCFVLPSLYGETWGLVVNEAMACRLPVIVSRECGCMATLVRDDYNGWQFNPHDTNMLGQIMNGFMNMSVEEKKQMGANSLSMISEWGLDRFCDGAWKAIKYCRQMPARSYASLLRDKFILNLWKGRYRPV